MSSTASFKSFTDDDSLPKEPSQPVERKIQVEQKELIAQRIVSSSEELKASVIAKSPEEKCKCSYEHPMTGLAHVSPATPYFSANWHGPSFALTNPQWEQKYLVKLCPVGKDLIFHPTLTIRRPSSSRRTYVAGIINPGTDSDLLDFLLDTGHSVWGQIGLKWVGELGDPEFGRQEVPVFVWQCRYDEWKDYPQHWLNALLDGAEDGDAWAPADFYGHELWEGEGAAEIDDLVIGRSTLAPMRVWEQEVHGWAPWGEEKETVETNDEEVAAGDAES